MTLRRAGALALALALVASALGADLAGVVSQDVVLFAEVADPKGVWADFQQSGLRDMIRGMPNGERAFLFGVLFVQQAARQRLGLPLGEFVQRYAQRFAVALLDVPGAGEPAVCLLLDASTTKAELDGLLGKALRAPLANGQPPPELADEAHQGVTYRRVSAGAHSAAYVFLGDVLALGSEAGVKKLIEGRALRPLASNQTFLRVRQKLAVPKGLVAYLNVRVLLAAVRPQLDANPEMARRLDDVGLTTVQWAAWSSAFDGRGVRDRLYLYTGERQVGLLRLLGSLSPGTSTAALVLPQESPVLAALTFRDGPELWQALLAYLEEGGEVEHIARLDEQRQAVRFRFGIDFERDVVDALGGEIFLATPPGYVTSHAAQGRWWPKSGDLVHIIGLRVAKPEAMAAAVHRFMASQPLMGLGVQRQAETYRGTEVNTLILPGRRLRPAYAFVGDYLLIARGEVIRRCIDARADSQGLAAARRFGAFLKQMPPRYHAMAYIDLEALLVAALTRGRGIEGGASPSPRAAWASQLRSAYAVLLAEDDGVVLEAYTRPGLLGVVSAVTGLAPRVPAPPPPTEGQF